VHGQNSSSPSPYPQRGATVGRALVGLVAAASLIAVMGCGTSNTAAPPNHATTSTASTPPPSRSATQALRTCVDRWNQGNMLGWGPALVNVSIRHPDARERADLGLRDSASERCLVSLATASRRTPGTACSGATEMPGHPRFCVNQGSTSACIIDTWGAYECSPHADDAAALRNKNATTDEDGVMEAHIPLKNTHATTPLAWQRRYPHTDGWIEPWTNSGALRPGLKFTTTYKHGGSCGFASEETVAKTAVRCVWRRKLQVDPCFPQRAHSLHRGAVLACPSAPGATTLGRFVITSGP
jgi:hypothetical protein